MADTLSELHAEYDNLRMQLAQVILNMDRVNGAIRVLEAMREASAIGEEKPDADTAARGAD